MKKLNNTRRITIDNDQVRFQFYKSDSETYEISLPIGFDYIVKTFFKHEIPSESDIEYAINYIEDELMSKKELISFNENLITEDKGIKDLFLKNGLTESIYSRQRVEELFNQYAYIVMGASPVISGIEITPKDVAVILLLREIMHHLDYRNISIKAL
ncbi:hypothetical protein [Carboxylicivirga caseinilyticus]|uniref:hypothetical protein n=1 Tax=Carboxylicivirga caseinilyticus TaxID=3417572 RepID=UPI003D330460|nr:hypothetical protein [Marinilabiliaceae bacterium A049]